MMAVATDVGDDGISLDKYFESFNVDKYIHNQTYHDSSVAAVVAFRVTIVSQYVSAADMTFRITTKKY
jgi:hypothetical protein